MIRQPLHMLTHDMTAVTHVDTGYESHYTC
jgi:hypothetical protein